LVEFPMAPGTPPTPEYLSRFFRLVGDPASRPVLVHCYAGFERSAAFVAAYRIHKQKWDADQAVEEMNRYGYSSLFWPKQEEFVRAFAAASVAQSAVEVARRAPVP
jgi:protein-tyrosine phosphatase